jgi:hypothetical protein
MFLYDMVSLSTVQRFINKANLTSKKLEPIDRRAFEFANDCWQSDISIGPYLTINGKKHKTHIFALIDDALWKAFHRASYGKYLTMES